MPRSHSAALVALLSLALVPLPASARAKKLRVLAEVNIEQRTESPTFYSSSKPRLMAQGKLLYLGHGLWQEQDRFELLDLASLKILKVQAPLAGFIESRQDLFPRARGTGHPLAVTDRMLFFDRQGQQAGLLFKDSYGNGQGRMFYLHWDLEKNKITQALELERNTRKDKWLEIKAIGYQAQTKTLYCQIRRGNMDREAGEGEELRIIAIRDGRVRTVASFQSQRKIFPGPYYDAKHNLALVTEYSELPLSGPEPVGYLIHLSSGQMDRIPIPETCYGAAFSSDGRTLYAYSNQRGLLWSISLPQGKYSKPVKVGSHGHALGFVRPQRLLLIRSEGLWALSPRLKKRQFWPMSKIAKGPFHVERSIVHRDRALIVDGGRLFVVAMPP